MLLAVSGSARAEVDEATRLLAHSCSLQGPTGWINIPSADVAGDNQISAAIHRGDAKINAGLWDVVEGGIFLQADIVGPRFDEYRNLSNWDSVKTNVSGFVKDTFFGQAKIKLLDQDWAGIGLAGGVERQDGYVVAQRYFSGVSRVTVLAGWGNGRFSKGFGGFSKTIAPGAEVTFEYDGTGMNTGIRMLLAENVVFNLAIQQLDTIGEVQNLGEVISVHLLFGITYLEKF